MRFERRELKPYAEPVSAADLKLENVYFFLTFSDDAMLIPNLEPMVFIGRDLEANDAGIVYFQDLESYQHGIRYDSSHEGETATFYCGSENDTGHIFDYDNALNELLRCSLRRVG